MEKAQVAIPEAGETFIGEDGSISVVLADTVDEDYEPTKEEIDEFAEWMGMDLPEDNEFLYLALEGLKAPLPAEWRPCRTEENEIYYFNFKTGESTWCHPMDEVYRERFMKAKEQKRAASAAGSGLTGRGLTAGMEGGPSSLLQKNSTPDAAGDSRGVPSQLPAGEPGKSPTPLGTKYPPLRSQPLPQVSRASKPQDNGALSAGSGAGGTPSREGESGGETSGKKRFISETEEILERRIREELEVAFLEEQRKAEASLEERRKNMQRAHDDEVKKLQASLEAKLAELRSAISQEDDETRRKKEEIESLWKDRTEELRKEEKQLQNQLNCLREENQKRVTEEVERAEKKAAADLEVQIKRIEDDARASLEKRKNDVRAEFTTKRLELEKKAKEELQRLKAEAEKRHAEKVALIQKNISSRKTKQEATVRASKNAVSAEIAAIRAKEQEEIAAIKKRSEEEQTALQNSRREAVNKLRKEISELQRTAEAPTACTAVDPPARAKDLEEVRRRWRAEEEKQMQLLTDERRAKIAELERSAAMSSSLQHSITEAGQTPSMLALLAMKENEQKVTEELFRSNLQEELTRADMPQEVQVAAAVDDAFRLFVRSNEITRKLEQDELERRSREGPGRRVADKQSNSADRMGGSEGASVKMEEEVRRRVQEKIRDSLQSMREEHKNAMRRLKQRYEEQRRELIAAVDNKMRVMEQLGRHRIEKNIDEQRKEVKQRTAPVTVAQGRSDAAGVPIELLQNHLNSIEAEYVEQIQGLEAELASLASAVCAVEDTYGIHEPESLVLQHQSQTQPPLQCGQQRKSPVGNGGSAFQTRTGGEGTLPVGTKKSLHPTSFSAEARLFLVGQLQDLSTRREALQSAREEWYHNIKAPNEHPTPMISSDKPGDSVEQSIAHTHMVDLMGSLGDRLERIMHRVEKLQTYADGKSPSRSRTRRAKVHDRRNCRGKAGKSAHKKHRHTTHSKGESQSNLVQKWSRILSDLAPSPLQSGGLSVLLQYLRNG
uniref:Uncharacterized protein TCIL3000_11_12260 n=1 Tax=Trypanosoma congolense (strain IL3000) TaxID=1068625 RepID=G0V261_TRYCI|nr:unnamed protein product [Trypanosoma congolense IL3000]